MRLRPRFPLGGTETAYRHLRLPARSIQPTFPPFEKRVPSSTTQFKRGNPGGPGRPRGSNAIKAAIVAALEEVGPDGETLAEHVAAVILRKALRSADFALKLARYLDPPARAVEAAVSAEECDTEELVARLEVLADRHRPRLAEGAGEAAALPTASLASASSPAR